MNLNLHPQLRLSQLAIGAVPEPNPATGRLSINSFIDWAP